MSAGSSGKTPESGKPHSSSNAGDQFGHGSLSREPVVLRNVSGEMVERSAERHPNVTPEQREARVKLKLGRKRRWFQGIVEQLIRLFAFASFAIIILIFIFVFREASPMFFGQSKESVKTADSLKALPPNVGDESSAVATSDGAGGANSAVDVKAKFKEQHKLVTKVDASGKKVTVTKEGGNVEQEVYDPLADDAPAAVSEKPKKANPPTTITPNDSVTNNAAVIPKKASHLKKTIASTSSDSASGKGIKAKKDTTSVAIIPSTKVVPPKQDLTYTKTTNGGAVAQEEYDPFANETGIATIKTPKTKTSKDGGTLAGALTVDSAALRQAQIVADSSKAKDAREQEELKHTTDLAHLVGTVWQPVSSLPKFGLWPLFIGTLKVTLLAILFGGPVAILAALFTSSFAPKWAREIIKPAIELLAGFPSVVIGFFALIVMATIFQNFFHYTYRLNSLLGGVAMSFAVIPIIYTITEDALTAVPNTLREASDALGATKWQTAFKVVLPAAIPGVFAAIVLGFGRAFGETMIALMATGNAALSSWNLIEPVRTFAATIGAEMAEVVFGDQHYNVLFFIGSLLFVFTFTMNAVVEFWVRKRLLRRIQGK